MKKSPTYVPCLHHPKQMQDVKKIWINIFCE
jgi:hypothetical protein